MAKASPARVAAVRLLGETRRRNARARELLRASSCMEALDARDRAFVSRLVMGVVGTRGLLDSVVDVHVAKRAHLEPKVRDALQLAAYELLFLSTAPSVAVSQGVELVRLARPRAAGMANAVLRRIADEDVPKRMAAVARCEAGPCDVEDLALACGYPTWLLNAVVRQRGIEVARRFARSAMEPAPVYVAANEIICTADRASGLLASMGMEPERVELPGAFVLGAPAGLAQSGLVDEAKVVVADLSAQRVAQLVAPSPGARVLEVGQGRGTKSILMQNAAWRAGGLARIAGVDSEPFKVEVARRRMASAGLEDVVSCTAFDACGLGEDSVPDELVGAFDTVFVDAPCSGTGTLRRHPEIAWNLSLADVRALAALQLRMLEAAATRVQDGGTLCYATCSILSEENEDVVDGFLAGKVGESFARGKRGFAEMPSLNGPDGHFCETLIKVR